MTLVIDASAALAWVFEDEMDEPSRTLLARVAQSGAIVPVIWRLETANGLRSALRRKRLSLAQIDCAIALLATLTVVDDLETNARAWTSIVALSDRYDLTPYDAAYLELAIRLGADIATRDEKLEAAAKAAGLTAIPC